MLGSDSEAEEFILQGWFGFTGSQLNGWPQFGRRMLLKASGGVEDCLVKMPNDEKIQAHKEAAIKRHEDALAGVHCVADGLKIPFQSCSSLLD